MFLALLLACGGPPALTFDKGVCASQDPCHVPMGANVLLGPLLDGAKPEQVSVDSSNDEVLAEGTSRDETLALWRTVAPGTATATLTAKAGGEPVERSWQIEVHAIADLGLEAPAEGIVAGTAAVFSLNPKAADGRPLVWDWLWIEQSQMLCIPDRCQHTFQTGDYALWNGTEAEPLRFTVE